MTAPSLFKITLDTNLWQDVVGRALGNEFVAQGCSMKDLYIYDIYIYTCIYIYMGRDISIRLTEAG